MRSMLRALIGIVVLASLAIAGEVRTTLALSGLTCAACSAAVTKALKQVDGVREVTVAEDRARAVVVTDERVPADALVQAVARLGYEAHVVTP
ncbi:MAG: heavy metal-associated domain-containing protein [Candidatus Binatia bacterium]